MTAPAGPGHRGDAAGGDRRAPPRAGPARRRLAGREDGHRARRGRLGRAAALALLVLATAVPAGAGHEGAEAPLAIAAEDLRRYRDAGEDVTVVDLRPADLYRGGHLPRARSIPMAELPARQAEVPRTGRVVLYAASEAEARGAYQALRQAGHRNVMVLAGGLPAWVRLGLPVERAP